MDSVSECKLKCQNACFVAKYKSWVEEKRQKEEPQKQKATKLIYRSLGQPIYILD